MANVKEANLKPKGNTSNGDGRFNLELPVWADTLTVQQRLGKWYNLFKTDNFLQTDKADLFSADAANELFAAFLKDIDEVPERIMNEFVNPDFIVNKQSYGHIMQALLINISDRLFLHPTPAQMSVTIRAFIVTCCKHIDDTIDFLRNFFYQYFDNSTHIPAYSQHEFIISYEKKFLQWPLLVELLNENTAISYSQRTYLEKLSIQLQAFTDAVSIKELQNILITLNFNHPHFIDTIKETWNTFISTFTSSHEQLQFYETEKAIIISLKTKWSIAFENTMPSAKKQLLEWLTDEIKQLSTVQAREAIGENPIAPEHKIQTTFSVAKLAVLIRLLVTDKIIINQPVAPALRTIAKTFTTLMKDEISYGSLETKYHAPDRTTLSTVKEILAKWIKLVDKL